MTRPSLFSVFGLIGILLVGAWLRLWNLGEISLWHDEMMSIGFARLPWGTLWLSGYDNHPPAYYSLLKLALTFGDSEWIIRAPSALTGIATIALIFWAGSIIAGARGGLGAALLFSLSAAQIEFSQEARPYSLLVFALAIAVIGFLMITSQECDVQPGITRRSKRAASVFGYALYTAGCLLALYAHGIAVFALACFQFAFLAFWIATKGSRFRTALPWLAANIFVFLLWLPWLVILVQERIGSGSFDWLEHASAASALGQLAYVHAFHYVWTAKPWIDIAMFVVLGIGAYRLRQRPHLLVLLVSIALVGPTLIWLVGFAKPIFMIRTIIWSGIGGSLLFGTAFSALNWRSWIPSMALVGIIALRSAYAFHMTAGGENEDWKGVYQRTRTQEAEADTPIASILCTNHAPMPLSYYSRHDTGIPRWYLWDATSQSASPNRPGGWRDEQALIDHEWETLNVVTSRLETLDRAVHNALVARGWTLLSEDEYKLVRIYGYRCPDGCRLPDGQR